jgi:hypothetical protein
MHSSFCLPSSVAESGVLCKTQEILGIRQDTQIVCLRILPDTEDLRSILSINAPALELVSEEASASCRVEGSELAVVLASCTAPASES